MTNNSTINSVSNQRISAGYSAAYAKMARGFARKESHGVIWEYSPIFERAGVHHGFSTRHGGVSASPFDSLNLGWNRPDNRESIRENYERLAREAGFEYGSMALVNYCHGDGVETAGVGDAGKGFGNGEFAPCDALVSLCKEVTLITLHADCMPVFLYDPNKRAVGMVHAGWKGASKRIGQKAAQKMIGELGCNREDILAAIGPSISQERFEVNQPVARIFEEEFPGVDCTVFNAKTQKHHIDLWLVMVAQLMDAGLLPENISLSGTCTYNCADYFSYRRDSGATGAMAGFIVLR